MVAVGCYARVCLMSALEGVERVQRVRMCVSVRVRVRARVRVL